MVILYEHLVCLDCATVVRFNVEMNDEHTKRYKEAQASYGQTLTYIDVEAECGYSVEPCSWCKSKQAGSRYLGIVHTVE